MSLSVLTESELLQAASHTVELEIPATIWNPAAATGTTEARLVRIRSLNVGTFQLIAKAGKDDPSLIPLLIVKEALFEPQLNFEQIKRLPVGLVHFLIDHIKSASGLTIRS